MSEVVSTNIKMFKIESFKQIFKRQHKIIGISSTFNFTDNIKENILNKNTYENRMPNNFNNNRNNNRRNDNSNLNREPEYNKKFTFNFNSVKKPLEKPDLSKIRLLHKKLQKLENHYLNKKAEFDEIFENHIKKNPLLNSKNMDLLEVQKVKGKERLLTNYLTIKSTLKLELDLENEKIIDHMEFGNTNGFIPKTGLSFIRDNFAHFIRLDSKILDFFKYETQENYIDCEDKIERMASIGVNHLYERSTNTIINDCNLPVEKEILKYFNDNGVLTEEKVIEGDKMNVRPDVFEFEALDTVTNYNYNFTINLNDESLNTFEKKQIRYKKTISYIGKDLYDDVADKTTLYRRL